MAETLKLNHPQLVAVWPGMGNVALNAGVYLLAKLNMTLVAEFSADELFEVEHVEVSHGILRLGRRPRHRVFHWSDPQGKRDLLVFLGEAQPSLGKYAFSRQLISFAQQHGVERVHTFAAMATRMHPEQSSRVFAAATDQENLDEWTEHGVEALEDGHVAGLNGILLGVAKQQGLHGCCLLGEMPHVFSQLPFPQGSLAILEAFAAATGIDIDLAELKQQAESTVQQLSALLEQVQQAYEEDESGADEDEFQVEAVPEEQLTAVDRRRIEQLFDEATGDRSKAFVLKQELDRLGVFQEFEDRFLDLFKKPD